MKRIALVLTIVLALSLWAWAAPGQLPFTEKQLGELKAEQAGMCPDGSPMSLRLYDPDPKDPTATIFVFARGNVVVALRYIVGDTDRVYIVAEGQWHPVEEIRAKYPSPCDIPFNGRP